MTAAADQPNRLAEEMGVSPSSFAFIYSPMVAPEHTSPPPPPPGLGAPTAMNFDFANQQVLRRKTHTLNMLNPVDFEPDHQVRAMYNPRVSPLKLDPVFEATYKAVNGHEFKSKTASSHASKIAHMRSTTVLQAPSDGLILNSTNQSVVDAENRLRQPEDDFYIEEVDMPEPDLQPAEPRQQRMHNTYANENASKIARLQFEFPDHPVPFSPMAHISRRSTNVATCPNSHNVSRDMRVALQAFARTALSRASTCYTPYVSGSVHDASHKHHQRLMKTMHPHSKTSAPMVDEQQVATLESRILVSVNSRVIFLGLPGNHSSAIEEYLTCAHGARPVSEAAVIDRMGAGGIYHNFRVALIDYSALVRTVRKYGVVINEMKDLMFASQGRTMLPGQQIGLPSLGTERFDAQTDIFAGKNATLSLQGNMDGLYEYMNDAARAGAVGCRGDWWPSATVNEDIQLSDVLEMYRRNSAIVPDGADFVFHLNDIYNETVEFDTRFGADHMPDTCLRPLSVADMRTPEPAALVHVNHLENGHSEKAMRLVCALHWQELVCTDSLPKECGPDAPLMKGDRRQAPTGTAYAWIDEVLADMQGDPHMDTYQMQVDSGTGMRPHRDFELEEESLICSRLDEMAHRQEAQIVGIVTVDTRAFSSPVHPGVKMWQAYAAAHGYVYISLHPGGDLNKASQEEQDWIASTRLLEVMLSDQYEHIHHFMYTELDQWMTRPMLRLDDLFRGVGLHRCTGPIMAAVAVNTDDTSTPSTPSTPTIDTSTFIFRRSPKMRKLLLEWSNQTFGYPGGNESMPISRQYAFMHNPSVYATYKDYMRVFPELPFGLPYSSMIQHATDESAAGYDLDLARDFQLSVITPCVLSALMTSQDHTCSLHPPMTGGHCHKTDRQLSIRLPNGTDHVFTARQCASEQDAAMPVQKYYELKAIFEANDPQRIRDALVDIYEGRLSTTSYSSRLHHLMPELRHGDLVPEEWIAGDPLRQDLEPALSQRLYYKNPIEMPSCEAWGTCDAPEGCFEQMLAVAKLPTTEANQWHDYATCLSEGSSGSASPLSSYCVAESCRRLAREMRSSTDDETPVDGGVGIVSIDSRSEHPTIDVWTAYARAHGYSYTHLISIATAEDIKKVADVNMLFDWRTNLKLLELMNNETYAHVNYWLYTELDQWITAPLTMRLEPLFIEHGLVDNRNDFVTVEEFPCRDVRGGGVFNMGTFLFRRGQGLTDLLTAWFNSTLHGGEHNASWPARQGAFSHDPTVYQAFKNRISVMPSACPLGSPYGIALGHVLGGSIVGAYDPERARDVFSTLVLPCAQDALDSGADHTCALHPPWSGGNCLICEQPMSITRSDGTVHNITAKACCGDTDAAIPLTKFRETATIFEAADIDAILEMLKGVYEGRGPAPMYSLLGAGLLPSEWRIHWNTAVNIPVPGRVESSAETLAYERAALGGWPSPPSPPPNPAVCDTPGCTVADWEGPRSLVYVSSPLTADTTYLDLFRNVHLYSGMPYAWGGRHAGWLADAQTRQLACALEVDPSVDPANGDVASCRCFLDYLSTYNLTAEGLFICHDTVGTYYNEMLNRVMPQATWVTTIRDPFEHAMASFVQFQAPILNESAAAPLMTERTCAYDGPGYRNKLSATCFVDYYVDAQLRTCKPQDNSLFFSQMCAVGFGARPTAASIRSKYTVLPFEDPITSFLAAMLLDWNFPEGVVRRLHEALDRQCSFGSALSLPASPSWINATMTKFPNMINGSEFTELRAKEQTFSEQTLESGTLHMHAVAQARHNVRRYYNRMNITSHRACWDQSKVPVPTRDYHTENLPYAETDRLKKFDNSNYRFSQIRLDQCMPGLPQNVNVTSNDDGANRAAHNTQEATALLEGWMNYARDRHGTQCYNTTGYHTDMSLPNTADALVSDRYKIAFETSAKSASMSATAYMQCRFDAAPNRTSYEDYTRMMILRNPTARSISAFFEISMHYLALLRLPPAVLRDCVAGWPNPGMTLMYEQSLWDPNGTFPEICRETYTRNSYTHEIVPRNEMFSDGESKARHAAGLSFTNTINIDRQTMAATSESSLLQALWELPAGCRQLGRTTSWIVNDGQQNNTNGSDAAHGVTWWCNEPECFEPCEITDNQMLNLFGHALADSAKQNMMGCDDQMFGGEHMWPQMVHVSRAGRADAIMRIEQVEEDSQRFEHFLEDHLGVSLPTLPPNSTCSMTSTHTNNGTVLEPALGDTSVAASIIERSPDLQRRICALYYHDFVCGGYELLPACKAPPSQWLNQTIDDMLADAPMVQLAEDDKTHAPTQQQQGGNGQQGGNAPHGGHHHHGNSHHGKSGFNTRHSKLYKDLGLANLHDEVHPYLNDAFRKAFE